MRRIQEEWENFWLAIQPKGAIALHIHLMRQAFFAGALSMLNACDETVGGNANVQEIREELEQFFQKDLQQG